MILPSLSARSIFIIFSLLVIPLKASVLLVLRVCALHKHEHTRLKALNKFKKYKFIFVIGQSDGSLLSRGCKSLMCQGNAWKH